MEIGWPKTNREWIYLVAILALVELIFLHAIYVYGHDADVKASWDFAAVLISIVLALIAILYSMVQGMTQQGAVDKLNNSASTLATQIQSLESVVGDVKSSKEALRSELELIGNVTSELQGLAEHVRTQEGHLASIKQTVNKIADDLNKPQSTHSGAASAKEPESAATLGRILDKLPFGSTVAVYAINKLGKKLDDLKFSTTISAVMWPKPANVEIKESNDGLWSGILNANRQYLYALGFISEVESADFLPAYKILVDKYFSVDPEFKNLHKWKEVREAIDKLNNSG